MSNQPNDDTFTVKWITPTGFTHFYQTRQLSLVPPKEQGKGLENVTHHVAFTDSTGMNAALRQGVVYIINGQGVTVDRVEPRGELLDKAAAEDAQRQAEEDVDKAVKDVATKKRTRPKPDTVEDAQEVH